MELSHGPWKEIFSGEWTGYSTKFYENPEKTALVIIEDRREGVIKGHLVITYQIYIVEGNTSTLAEKLPGNTIVLEKHYPSFKAKYLIMSPGPSYVKVGESMNMVLDNSFRKLEEMHDKLMEESAAYDIRTVPLKNSPEEYIARLFSEPFLLPSILIRKAAASAATPGKAQAMAKALLGRRITGELADENIQSFASTIVIGDSAQARNAFHILMENCVLTGITGIVLDENKEFLGMEAPNKNFNQQEFPNLQPIGMPVNTVSKSQVHININHLNGDQLREALELPRSDKNPGEEAGKLLDKAIESHAEEYSSLKGMEEEILANTPESKKFYAYQAIRMIRVLHKAHPSMFGGRIDLNSLVSPYLKRVGSIARIDVSGYPEHVKRLLAFSVVKSLYKKYKGELASRELKALVFMKNGPVYTADTPTGRELKNMMLDSINYGVGTCISAAEEADLDPVLIKNATIKIEFTGEKEVAVKEMHSRPYRAVLRDPLSA